MLCFYVKYRVLRFFSSYLCTQNIIVMVDKRTLEFILTDHESGEIEEDGHKMKIQPVYEWSLELGV